MAYSGGSLKVVTAIQTLMLEVPGVVNVFDYVPLARDWKAFLDKFQNEDKVHGWTIRRKNTGNSWLTNDENLWVHTMLIRGYFGLYESSQTGRVFPVMIDDVVNKFDGEKTLNGTVEEHQPAQVRTEDERIIGGVLVHYCEIEIVCQERITRLHGG